MPYSEKTKRILELFEQISAIPRCSGNLDKVLAFLQDWAKDKGFPCKQDEAKNLLIEVPASPGYENAPTVVMQGHTDMVCQKTKTSSHDFSKDPIQFVYDGEWLKAKETSLGADNGIAIAICMALVEDETIQHPPLELLFTSDEETGLVGANALTPDFFKGNTLINLDSEDEGYLTVGCAGGMATEMNIPWNVQPVAGDWQCFQLTAGGMRGGHSGVDIHLGKPNALKVLARSLFYLSQDMDLRLAGITGGSAHNAIPRDAESLIWLPADKAAAAKKKMAEITGIFKNEFGKNDPDILITLEPVDQEAKALSPADSRRIIDLLLVIPHGVFAMSMDIDNLVETSNNLAIAKLQGDSLYILTSQRSSVISRLYALSFRIESACRLAGGSAKSAFRYPPWQPNMDSLLLKKSVKLYKDLFQRDPVIDVIHAGLECGIIGDKKPGMDMISIGPTIKYPHSPDEKLHLPTIDMVWQFLAALLPAIK